MCSERTYFHIQLSRIIGNKFLLLSAKNSETVRISFRESFSVNQRKCFPKNRITDTTESLSPFILLYKKSQTTFLDTGDINTLSFLFFSINHCTYDYVFVRQLEYKKKSKMAVAKKQRKQGGKPKRREGRKNPRT